MAEVCRCWSMVNFFHCLFDSMRDLFRKLGINGFRAFDEAISLVITSALLVARDRENPFLAYSGHSFDILMWEMNLMHASSVLTAYVYYVCACARLFIRKASTVVDCLSTLSNKCWKLKTKSSKVFLLWVSRLFVSVFNRVRALDPKQKHTHTRTHARLHTLHSCESIHTEKTTHDYSQNTRRSNNHIWVVNMSLLSIFK